MGTSDDIATATNETEATRMQVRTQLEYVHCKEIPGSTLTDVHEAIPAAISVTTVNATLLIGAEGQQKAPVTTLLPLPKKQKWTRKRFNN